MGGDTKSNPSQTTISAGASSPPSQANIASIDWLGSDQVSKAESSHVAPPASQPALSTNADGAAADFFQSSCRPWERGDLLRRLATFKHSTWASKPKVISLSTGLFLASCIVNFKLTSHQLMIPDVVFFLRFPMYICLESPSPLNAVLEQLNNQNCDKLAYGSQSEAKAYISYQNICYNVIPSVLSYI
jgi:hypothetical protein